MNGGDIAGMALGFIGLFMFVAAIILSLTSPTDGEDDPYDD